jgi:hypothetical protein
VESKKQETRSLILRKNKLEVDEMLEENETHFDLNEQSEFDYYLMWEWPDHIERAMRRMLWISLVEAAEGYDATPHTSYIRWMIATHPESPAAVLDYLANLGDEELLVRIAENPQASTDTLTRLAKSQHASVRIAVADNPNTPIHVVKGLTLDEALDVRYSLAENPALPASILIELSNDDNAYVATRAKKTILRRNPASVERFPSREGRDKRRLG